MAPTVSVITAAYNAGATIERAVRSALAQTLADLEIVVVDDGSADDTVARVEALQRQDARIVLLRHPANVGPAGARNTALAAARGTWVTPLDADDAYHPQRLARLCAEAEARQADFMADNLVFDDTERIGSPEHAWPPPFLDGAVLDAAQLIESDMPRNGVTSLGYLKPLMRREFLERHRLRYDRDLHGPEDFNLYLSAVIAGARFCTMGWSGYRYYRSAGSVTRTPGRERILRNLEEALASNRKLALRAQQAGADGVVALLQRHRARMLAVRWLDRVRHMLASRHWRGLVQGLAALPPPVALARYVLERLARGPQRNLPTEPARRA